MKTSYKFLVLFPLLTGLANLVSAAVSNTPPIFWPEKRLIPIQISHTTTIADGLEFNITQLNNSVLPLYSYSFSQWKVVPQLNFRNASLALANKRNPSIKAGLSIVKSEDWLKTLGADTLERYVASISYLNPGRFTLLNPGTAFGPIQRTGYFIGNPYKMVHYQIKPEEETEPTLVIWDFITEVDGSTFILSFECPQKLASLNSATPLALMSSLGTLDDFE